ncbi:alpha-tocopherol transfer protein-like [Varroa destructor]|uniref:CRAL-TRIO domain-containing protein n=1 Tax=Varroa destructor TaxID=109461 RepID=A0A7M7KCG3_VARDE|nr:alpha-tocopherol transfer protein-like [Varroa destructor]
MKEQVINNLDAWKLDFNAKVPDKDPLLVENSLKELKERLSDGIPGWEHILDDKHLLKFLRYKDLNVPATFKMFDLIHKRRMAEPTRYFPEGKGPLHYKHVYELRCAEVLHHRNPRDGTAVVIIRVGDWKPETGVDYFTSQNAGIFLVEYVLDDERVQRDGVTLIIDFKGFRFSWVMQFFPPSYLPTIITTLQDTAPIRFIGIHILNQPVMYKILYGMAYPFISKEDLLNLKISKKFTSMGPTSSLCKNTLTVRSSRRTFLDRKSLTICGYPKWFTRTTIFLSPEVICRKARKPTVRRRAYFTKKRTSSSFKILCYAQ